LHQEDEEDNLFGNDYNTGFVKTLLRVQNNVINLPGGREHFDIYLAKTIYPVLVPGLENLAREIDRVTSGEGII
jgi:hypothetical protein